MNEPELLSRREDGAELAMALWRFGSPLLALSSAPYGGGWGERRWVLAAQVAGGYSRSDPAGHLAELARGLDLAGPGIGMLTAVDVRLVSTCRGDRCGRRRRGNGQRRCRARGRGRLRRHGEHRRRAAATGRARRRGIGAARFRVGAGRTGLRGRC